MQQQELYLNMEQSYLRARVYKAYEDAKDDRNDAATLGIFFVLFLDVFVHW